MSKHHEPKEAPKEPVRLVARRGDIVDYTEVPNDVSRTGVAAPALVTGVNPDGTVSLRVFALTGDDYRIPNVRHGNAKPGTPEAYGTWTERV